MINTNHVVDLQPLNALADVVIGRLDVAIGIGCQRYFMRYPVRTELRTALQRPLALEPAVLGITIHPNKDATRELIQETTTRKENKP